MKRRILIVDDHPLLRAGLRTLIEAEADLEVCGEASTYSEALELVQSTRPDLAIVDLSLAEGSGLELIRRLGDREGGAQVLVCSMHEESLFAPRVLQAGARGYISKQEAIANMILAIRQVLAGKVYMSAAMTERVLQGLTSGGPTDEGTAITQLTDRELDVLGLIGRGLSTSQIATQLHLSIKTIEAHREKIKKRLNLSSGSELVRYAVQWTLEQGGGGMP